MQDHRTTIKHRASAIRPVAHTPTPDIEEDDRYYRPTQPARSAFRYTTQDGQEVIQQGRRRLVIHREPHPRKRHWLFPVAMTMLVTLFLVILGNMISNWWGNYQLNAQYGYPRTWQIDVVVGHADSSMHPTHFIFENLHGKVTIIEIPGGDLSHVRIYSGSQIFGDNADSIPVTGEFKDVNGDGRVDMIVHVGNQSFVYLNDGTLFKSQQ